jgi:hypothetical protein
MPDRMQQVGLAQPGVAVDEQRVVGLGRRLGDRDRRGVREPVARSDHERLERVLGVEPGAAQPRTALTQVDYGTVRALVRAGRLVQRAVLGLRPVSLDMIRFRVRRGGRLGGEIADRRGRRGAELRRRVDGDGQLDVPAELLGQGLGNQRAQPGLQLLLDELVGGGDQRRVLHQPERAGQLQPGPLMRLNLQVSKPVEGSCPDFRQVGSSHLCAPLASPCREPSAHDPQNHPHVVHVASQLHAVTGAVRGE